MALQNYISILCSGDPSIHVNQRRDGWWTADLGRLLDILLHPQWYRYYFLWRLDRLIGSFDSFDISFCDFAWSALDFPHVCFISILQILLFQAMQRSETRSAELDTFSVSSLSSWTTRMTTTFVLCYIWYCIYNILVFKPFWVVLWKRTKLVKVCYQKRWT